LRKIGFRENKEYWIDTLQENSFVVSSRTLERTNYSTFIVDVETREILETTPIISVLGHAIRKEDRYIISSKFQWGPYHAIKEKDKEELIS